MQAGSGIQTIYVTNLPPQSHFKMVGFKEISHSFNILENQPKEDCSTPLA